MSQSHFSYETIRANKKMRFWRLIAVLLLVGAVIFLSGRDKNKLSSSSFLGGGYIGRIHIDGMIIDEQDYSKKIRKLADDNSLKAVIVSVDSPGGTTVDSQRLYEALLKLKEKKPMVIQMENVAASGGYIVSLAGNHIIASGNTITGSVGVIMQSPEISGLMEKFGVGLNEIRTTSLKGEPSLYYPMSPAAKENLTAMVEDSYAWFKGMVKENRPKMSKKNFEVATTGAVFSGRQALKLGLIDELGSEEESLNWLKKNHKIDDKLEIVEITKEDEEKTTLLDKVFVPFLDRIFGFSLKNTQKYSLPVDAMLCLWQS